MMDQPLRRAALLGAILSLTLAGEAHAFDKIAIPAKDGVVLTGWLARPSAAGPAPVVIGLHGCAGLYNRQGEIGAREADWSRRFTAAGYTTLLLDSFGPRGIRSLCNDRERALTPADRAGDVFSAVDWVVGQGFADRKRISVIGWSNGGSTALRVAGNAQADRLAHVIAFYPGCSPLLKRAWRPRTDTVILQGLADDWTPAAPCQDLAERSGARFIGFAGAYHDFDHPSLTRRERKAAYSQRSDGMVTIGSDPEARAKAIEAVMAILKGP